MFDFGFSELILVVLVALVVLSPKDFAKISRTLGEWVAKGRGYWRELNAQIKDENAVQDIKAFRDEMKHQVRHISSELKAEQQNISREIRSELPRDIAPDLDINTSILGLDTSRLQTPNIQKAVLSAQTLEKARLTDPFANPHNLPPTYDELVEQVRSLHQRLMTLEISKTTVAVNQTTVIGDKHVES